MDNLTFDKYTFATDELSGKEFSECTFSNCNFSGMRLSGSVFMECRFENCNLSLCQVVGTGFQQVHFSDCKLSGVDFTASRDFLFSVQFNRCIIEYVLFSRKKMKKTHFSECRIC